MPGGIEAALDAAGYTVAVRGGGWIRVTAPDGTVRRFHGRARFQAWAETGRRRAWRGGFDGAAEPTNPGPAAWGAWLDTPWGDRAWEAGMAIGFTSNNVAEWTGLIRLLEAARARGVRALSAIGDSQLVVYQFQGHYAIRQPHLAALADQAWALARGLALELNWVPRDRNARADALSKAALRAASPTRFPPDRLERLDRHRWVAHGTADYRVDTRARTCTCPAFTRGRRPCKHLAAALLE
ncbi:MAG: reverse transcriptase-like protein [Firmicutes bacterium]|nr:reverse transcriptase-like protein [Bacillota bacterium]